MISIKEKAQCDLWFHESSSMIPVEHNFIKDLPALLASPGRPLISNVEANNNKPAGQACFAQ